MIRLLVEMALVGAQTGWLILGALENIRSPAANGSLVAQVFRMEMMRTLYPELYVALGRNRVEHPAPPRHAFIAIVVAESLVSLIMLAGTLLMAAALLGWADAGLARAVATIVVLGFTMIWSAFLVGGQWFHYWAGHEGAQVGHFLLAIWGSVVLAILVL